ncbi:hypothetical protein OBBRIDRAFT_827798 [Obba rivulosa]|uniref:Nitrate reductase [NADPH] n=1 Tax=Obba rivulosa TaxID=1052685 RepID=A0A8E2ASP3_9APHY|nr:hypothetical protein OBBRIDRAFT_827798 [Obba rivulosa]
MDAFFEHPTPTSMSARPPWRTPHDVRLQPPDVYHEIAARSRGADDTSRHRPLKFTSWDGGRKAGTYGDPAHAGHHPDDAHPPEGEAENSALIVGKKLWERTKQDVEEKGGWEAILKDGSTALTVRDVKKATPNSKRLDPQHHAFARFVLPIAESALKSQEWPGKKHEDDKEENKEDDKAKKKSSKDKEVDGSDQEKQDDQEDAKEKTKDKNDKEDAKPDPAMERFTVALTAEMHASKTLRNNDGKVIEPLKLLDGDFLAQLESTVSVEDQATPDSWIPRSSHLLRLTGKHPLNAEPNLSALHGVGMITPTKLHYVRSHGAVPPLDWNMHILSVMVFSEGGRQKTRDWTMDDLVEGQFPVSEFPVTFACDGNRRKEVNMIKRSAAFNWSAAGVSTCVWRGVHVRDVLIASGLTQQPENERWFLNYEGADEPSEGAYATSIPLAYAMDPANDVMLVFGQNGRVLHPDHGYPLRSIIPGMVGGRHVKWLKKVWVSKHPNDSHYHIWDNKVVPSFIDSKEHPLASIFFHHEDTAVYQQALQSIICKPAHDERVPLPSGQRAFEQAYTLEGFAYDGAGSCVQRIELTLDGGKTWKYCLKKFLDAPLRHGTKHWAWVFWFCEVTIGELVNCEEIALRAWDTKNNTQPEHIIWNYMGMMNNAWYRVRSMLETHPETLEPVIHFRHPVAPGNEEGGWMTPNPEDERTEESGGQSDKEFSLEEISKHNKTEDAWLILDGKVYDVTSVLSWHPGGAQAILAYAGKATVDSTNQYKGIHDNCTYFSVYISWFTINRSSEDANSKQDECLIGTLSKEGIEAMENDAERTARELKEVKERRKSFALQPDAYIPAKLIRRVEKNEDTRLYTFELPKEPNGENGVLGLPVGQHVQIALHFKDQSVIRSYTPTRPVLPSEEDGTFDLLVKTYLPSEHGPFPPGGTISNYLDTMQEGEEIDIMGPNGGIEYEGRGIFKIDGKNHHFRRASRINLVAGGSGLTPHWQLIHAILSDKEDQTRISLIDSNKTHEDILLHEELQEYADEEPERFQLWHVLSSPPKDKEWTYSTGHLDKDIMQQHFFPAEDNDVAAFLCGPPGLIEKAAVPGLKELGFEEGKTFFGF